MIAINSVEVLKQHCDDSPYNEFFLRLNPFCRSTKTIQYYSDVDVWYIINQIDDSEIEYGSTKELIENEPLIIKAMAHNAFFKND
jgi:hypothetical protein